MSLSVYPGTLDSYTVKKPKVDPNASADMNAVQDAVVAIETSVGVNPQGSQANLSTRLNLLMDGFGGIISGTSFPGSPRAFQAFYRSDQDIFYIRNAGNTAWIAMAQGSGHSFSAFNNAIQTISSGTVTQLTFNTEDFDTGNDFASSNFTTPTAGRYLFTFSTLITSNASSAQIFIYKNGNMWRTLTGAINTGAIPLGISGSIIMSLAQNDVVGIYIQRVSGSASMGLASNDTTFTGSLLA